VAFGFGSAVTFHSRAQNFIPMSLLYTTVIVLSLSMSKLRESSLLHSRKAWREGKHISVLREALSNLSSSIFKVTARILESMQFTASLTSFRRSEGIVVDET
jgi:hypothetical protein